MFELISLGLGVVIVLLLVVILFARNFILLPIKALMGKKKGAILTINIGKDRNVYFDVVTPKDGKKIVKKRDDGLDDDIDIDGSSLFFISALGLRLAFIFPDAKENVDPFSNKMETLTAPRLRNMMRTEREIGANENKKKEDALARYITFTFFLVLGIGILCLLTFLGVNGLEETLLDAIGGGVKAVASGETLAPVLT